VTMLASEAETVGAFAGGAIASPLVQLGTLISVISFIFASQPRLGVLALAVVFPQAAIVVALQNRINQRVRERVQAVRDASDRISVSDLRRVEDEVLADFRDAFEARRRIFRLKLSAKLALGAISALGKVGVLFLGGWLVLDGPRAMWESWSRASAACNESTGPGGISWPSSATPARSGCSTRCWCGPSRCGPRGPMARRRRRDAAPRRGAAPTEHRPRRCSFEPRPAGSAVAPSYARSCAAMRRCNDRPKVATDASMTRR
jgi:hypothetical protein